MRDKIFILFGMLICIFWSVNNHIVLEKDNTPFVFDIQDIYIMSTTFYGYVTNFQISEFFSYYTSWEKDYPPFIIFQPIPFYILMGVSEDTAAFSNIIHIFILFFSVYFIGKKLHSQNLGIFSGILVSINPWVHSISRIYLAEFALISIISLTLAFFLYSDNFRNKKFTVLFGISFGLGMLVKFTFLLYFLPLFFLFILVNAAKIMKHAYNLIYAAIPFFALVLTWYPMQIMQLFLLVRHNAVFFDQVVMNGPSISEKLIGALVNYYNLMEFDIMFFSVLFGLIALATISRDKTSRLFLFSFLASFAVLLFYIPTIRFFLPLSLHLSIMAGYGLIALKNVSKKNHVYIAYAIILIAFLLINRQPYERKTVDAVFSSGLYSPKIFDLDETIYLTLEEDRAAKSVFILTSSPTISLMERKLSKIKEVEGIFCLFNPEFYRTDFTYCIEQVKKISDCSYDAVITSSPSLTRQRQRYLSAYETQNELFEDALTSWQGCKDRYYRNYSYYEETEDIEISLWKRKQV